MTMTTRKSRAPKPSSDTVTVTVIEPFLVFHDGQQRGGTLTNVPVDKAEYWQKHGWVTVEEDKRKTEPSSDK